MEKNYLSPQSDQRGTRTYIIANDGRNPNGITRSFAYDAERSSAGITGVGEGSTIALTLKNPANPLRIPDKIKGLGLKLLKVINQDGGKN